MKHDTKVRWDKMYSNQLSAEDIDELLTRRHCGGTSHKDVFSGILNYIKHNQDENQLSLVILVTDLYSDIESSQNIIPPYIPRIYLRSDETKSIDSIIGKVITI